MPKEQTISLSFHQYNPFTTEVTLSNIQSVLHLCQIDAANQLGISISSLRTSFNKHKNSLGLKRWKVNSRTRKTSSVDSNSVDNICRNSSNVDNVSNIIKTEPTDEMVHHKSTIHTPIFDKKKLFKNVIKKGSNPLAQLVPTIQFIPRLSHTVYDTLLDKQHVKQDITIQLDDFMMYMNMKNLEHALCERLLGRVAHGFKKNVRHMPVTFCTRDVFEMYFYGYKSYYKSSNRKLLGYNIIGDRKEADGLCKTFNYPYLPEFCNRHWTMNEYSLLIEDDDKVQESKDQLDNLMTQFDQYEQEMYGDFFNWVEEENDFNEGWEHFRNVVLRLTICHNSITKMVTVSFEMQSLRLESDMKFVPTA